GFPLTGVGPVATPGGGRAVAVVTAAGGGEQQGGGHDGQEAGAACASHRIGMSPHSAGLSKISPGKMAPARLWPMLMPRTPSGAPGMVNPWTLWTLSSWARPHTTQLFQTL